MSKMSAQQLVLNWKDHNAVLVSVLENLLKSSSLVDCTLAAEGQYLKAHKVVLSACSSYFESLFMQENEKNPIVILKDVKFQELEAAVHFMYKGEVEVCEDRLAELLEVANCLQIKGLGRGAKSQDSKEISSSVKISGEKSVLTDLLQSRKDDLNSRINNAAQSSNLPTDYEQTINTANSSVHLSSHRESSPFATSCVGSSSCTVRIEPDNDVGNLENIPQSLALHSEKIPIIKTEPETDTLIEEKLCEPEKECGNGVTVMCDKDDWVEPNTDNMEVEQTNQYNAGWIVPDNEQIFSSVIMKEEPGTSASWNQEAVEYSVSASGDLAEPCARTSAASTGVDNLVIEDNDHQTPASLQSCLPVVGSCRTNISVKPVDTALRQISPQPPSKEFTCPSCKMAFARMIDLETHMQSQRCSTFHSCLEAELLPTDPLFQQPPLLQISEHKSSKRGSFKCSECCFVSPFRSRLELHLRIHTRKKLFKCQHCNSSFGQKAQYLEHITKHTVEKPFKCSYCDYASNRKLNLEQHLRIHTGENPFKCSDCSYTSCRKSSLTRHIETHARKKTFKC